MGNHILGSFLYTSSDENHAVASHKLLYVFPLMASSSSTGNLTHEHLPLLDFWKVWGHLPYLKLWSTAAMDGSENRAIHSSSNNVNCCHCAIQNVLRKPSKFVTVVGAMWAHPWGPRDDSRTFQGTENINIYVHRQQSGNHVNENQYFLVENRLNQL